jgi:hypothetical protein
MTWIKLTYKSKHSWNKIIFANQLHHCTVKLFNILEIISTFLRFQILIAGHMMIAFSYTVLYSLVETDLCFRGAYCLHHQGDESSPWWTQYTPLKHQSTSMRLQAAVSQQTVVVLFARMSLWIHAEWLSSTVTQHQSLISDMRPDRKSMYYHCITSSSYY